MIGFTPLRERLKLIEEYTIRTIYMRFANSGWARFTIDDKLGALTIESDWGAWTHIWGGGPSAWGKKTFTEFLADRSSYHYLADKLMYGKVRTVIDGKATRAELGKKILKERRERKISRHAARDYWESAAGFVRDIEDKEFGDHIWVALRAYSSHQKNDISDFFPEIHNQIATRPHHDFEILTGHLLPLLVERLRGELHVADDSTASTPPA